MFGTESFASVVPILMGKGDLGAAMWAARLTVARENAATGEALTDAVLTPQPPPRDHQAAKEH
jgi:hypothetical protein